MQRSRRLFSSSSGLWASGRRKDYHQILRVPRTATLQEINLSKLYHPDHSKEHDAVRLFSEITEAREALCHPELRDAHDAESVAQNFSKSRAMEIDIARKQHELLEKLRSEKKLKDYIQSRQPRPKPDGQPATSGSTAIPKTKARPQAKPVQTKFHPNFFTKAPPPPPKPKVVVTPPMPKQTVRPLYVPNVPPSREDLKMYEIMRVFAPISKGLFPNGDDPFAGIGWWQPIDGRIHPVIRPGVPGEVGEKALEKAFQIIKEVL
ncbi:hypothetical protein HWV62_42956 [Athelia sp. TMB]|nr:hypothetical protein HWV62_42956 [Athelia sp. TMB]